MTARTRRKKGAVRESTSDATTSGNRTVGKRAKNLLLDADALANAESLALGERLPAVPFRRRDGAELSPAVRWLSGIAAGSTADRETYREYLVAKYGGR